MAYTQSTPESISPTSAPNVVVPPRFLGRSAPNTGSFHHNTPQALQQFTLLVCNWLVLYFALMLCFSCCKTNAVVIGLLKAIYLLTDISRHRHCSTANAPHFYTVRNGDPPHFRVTTPYDKCFEYDICGVCQQWFGLLTPISVLFPSSDFIAVLTERPARDIDDGRLQSAHSTRYEPGWSRRVLDIHTTSITYSSYRYSSYRASSFLPISAEGEKVVYVTCQFRKKLTKINMQRRMMISFNH